MSHLIVKWNGSGNSFFRVADSRLVRAWFDVRHWPSLNEGLRRHRWRV